MLKAVIIDDEVAAQKSLEKIIQLYLNESVKIEGISSSLKEGIQLIHKHKPEIVFLDIEMPFQNGLELFDYMEINFDVVVISAYKDYAIDALRNGASDYLLKPVNVADLKKCIHRIESQHRLLQEKGQNQNRYEVGKLIVPYAKGYFVIPYSDIIAIEADGNYSWVYKLNQEKLQVNKTLGTIEENLPPQCFFRCHRSAIVNIHYVTEINREKCTLAIHNKHLPITERNIKPLMDKLKAILNVDME
ncbi:LytTR family two component transcriptional regulator [Breznakibacter xylanolyticus]|uniref:LytTR family two component transcriptional regulator n=1 Tax=Breznakibacter xylanolyticus TaxID=990 RepID=A0A2W7N9M6_9BACT|nr:LytTR family DNA-binding domain-containing protein [Breznakibacter xylanolyticus]MBN2744439.1 response regulator transcription factor [Marinilabiliaceae bacterium]PZX13564.1 LytTR family two component transcriptional regulator [Breznakibacter xylanolyticus]